jgi:hypothetical protein
MVASETKFGTVNPQITNIVRRIAVAWMRVNCNMGS